MAEAGEDLSEVCSSETDKMSTKEDGDGSQVAKESNLHHLDEITYSGINNMANVKINKTWSAPDCDVQKPLENQEVETLPKNKRTNREGRHLSNYPTSVDYAEESRMGENYKEGHGGCRSSHCALSLMRYYISELERVASNVEAILNSHSPENSRHAFDKPVSAAVSSGGSAVERSCIASNTYSNIRFVNTKGFVYKCPTSQITSRAAMAGAPLEEISLKDVDVFIGKKDLVDLTGESHNFVEEFTAENMIMQNQTANQQCAIQNQTANEQCALQNKTANEQCEIQIQTANEQCAIQNQRANEQSAIQNQTANEQSAIQNQTTNEQSAIQNQTTNEQCAIQNQTTNEQCAIQNQIANKLCAIQNTPIDFILYDAMPASSCSIYSSETIAGVVDGKQRQCSRDRCDVCNELGVDRSDDCLDVPSRSTDLWLKSNPPTTCLACSHETDTQGETIPKTISSSVAPRQLHKNENSNENVNNNGNYTSSTPRNFTLSSVSSNGPTLITNECLNLKIKTQSLKHSMTVSGNEVLVFKGSKVFSITQKAMKNDEIVGRVVCDMNKGKDEDFDRARETGTSQTNLRVSARELAGSLQETRDVRNVEGEIYGKLGKTVQKGQIMNSRKLVDEKTRPVMEFDLARVAKVEQNKCLDFVAQSERSSPRLRSTQCEQNKCLDLPQSVECACLNLAQFKPTARLNRAQSEQDELFKSAQSEQDELFKSPKSEQDERFKSPQFEQNARFKLPQSEQNARSSLAQSEQNELFKSPKSEQDERFKSPQFEQNARFKSPQFEQNARFKSPQFEQNARFKSPQFEQNARFKSPQFEQNARFKLPQSEQNARFKLPQSEQNARFKLPQSEQNARFKLPQSEQNARSILPQSEQNARSSLPQSEQDERFKSPQSEQNARFKSPQSEQDERFKLPQSEQNERFKLPQSEQDERFKLPQSEQDERFKLPQFEQNARFKLPQSEQNARSSLAQSEQNELFKSPKSEQDERFKSPKSEQDERFKLPQSEQDERSSLAQSEQNARFKSPQFEQNARFKLPQSEQNARSSLAQSEQNELFKSPKSEQDERFKSPKSEQDERFKLPQSEQDERFKSPKSEHNARFKSPQSEQNARSSLPQSEQNELFKSPKSEQNARSSLPQSEQNELFKSPKSEQNARSSLPQSEQNARFSLAQSEENAPSSLPQSEQDERFSLAQSEQNARSSLPQSEQNARSSLAQSETSANLNYTESSTTQIIRVKSEPKLKIINNQVRSHSPKLNVTSVEPNNDKTIILSPKRKQTSMHNEMTEWQNNWMNELNKKKLKNIDSLDKMHKYQDKISSSESDITRLKPSQSTQAAHSNSAMQQKGRDEHAPASRRKYTNSTGETLRPRVSEDTRWAPAIGREVTTRLSNTEKLQFPRKHEFPMRIRSALKNEENDMNDISDKTRRLTVESPAENLLVQTVYVRPNPYRAKEGIHIEMARCKSRFYLGEDEESFSTVGTRRLICDAECFSSKDPATKSLVVENGRSGISDGGGNEEFSERKERARDDSVAAEGGKMICAGNEVTEVGGSDGSEAWIGSNPVKMIGKYVVIGSAQSVRSVITMVQNQVRLAITAGHEGDSKTPAVRLGEAGDVGDTAQRKVIACESGRFCGSGDHLTLAKQVGDGNNSNTDDNNMNNNNSNICLQRGNTGFEHRRIILPKIFWSLYKVSSFDIEAENNKEWLFKNIRLFNDIDCSKSICDCTVRMEIKHPSMVKDKDADIAEDNDFPRKEFGDLQARIRVLASESTERLPISPEPNINNSSACEDKVTSELVDKALMERDVVLAGSNQSRQNSPQEKHQEDNESKTTNLSSSFPVPSAFSSTENVFNNDFVTQVDATNIATTVGTRAPEQYFSSRSSTSSQENKPLVAGECVDQVISNGDGVLQTIQPDKDNLDHGLWRCQPPNFQRTTTQEVGTTVTATDINPSRFAQTGDSFLNIHGSTVDGDVEESSLQLSTDSIFDDHSACEEGIKTKSAHDVANKYIALIDKADNNYAIKTKYEPGVSDEKSNKCISIETDDTQSESQDFGTYQCYGSSVTTSSGNSMKNDNRLGAEMFGTVLFWQGSTADPAATVRDLKDYSMPDMIGSQRSSSQIGMDVTSTRTMSVQDYYKELALSRYLTNVGGDSEKQENGEYNGVTTDQSEVFVNSRSQDQLLRSYSTHVISDVILEVSEEEEGDERTESKSGEEENDEEEECDKEEGTSLPYKRRPLSNLRL